MNVNLASQAGMGGYKNVERMAIRGLILLENHQLINKHTILSIHYQK